MTYQWQQNNKKGAWHTALFTPAMILKVFELRQGESVLTVDGKS